MKEKQRIKISLTGTPNSGKTSVFNRLTGLNQHVGNYPGVTVDKKTGTLKNDNGETAEILDLPGTYSLYPVSDDERVVIDVLLDEKGKLYPDKIVYVVNSAHIERCLMMLTQISDLGLPVICCLNMLDVSDKGGIHIDPTELEERLGIPVVKINARTGEGMPELKELIFKHQEPRSEKFVDVFLDSDLAQQIAGQLSLNTRYSGHLHACHVDHLKYLDDEQKQMLRKAIEESEFSRVKAEIEDKKHRIELINSIAEKSVKKTLNLDDSSTSRIDKILTHKVWGTFIFIAILFIIFQSIFSFASMPMDWIDQGFASLTSWTNSMLPEHWLSDLLTDGVLAGIGGIVIFVPQIAILFGLVAILEESGYMPRAVYLSDSLMKRTGMNGRSLVALISGVACAVPAIMSTRTIGNKKERLTTIFVTPFISCSARLPVFVVLTAFAVPKTYYAGFISLQGLVMMFLYVLGVVAAILSAWVMKKILKTKESSFLMLELPSYQWPQWKNIGITMYEKSKVFVINAGQVILIISIVLWALVSFGPGDKMELAKTEVLQQYETSQLSEQEINNIVAAKQLEYSYAGYLGKAIEPAIRPLGFDWKMGIALITSFAAREVFVSTMATIYSAGSEDDEQTIIERMRKQKIPGTNELVYTRARSFSLMIFYVFAMQCMSTIAIVRRETKSWTIPIYQFLYMTGLAYLASFITYSLLS